MTRYPMISVLILMLAEIVCAQTSAELASNDPQQQFETADAQLRQADADLAQQQAAMNELVKQQGGSGQELATSLTAADTARQGAYGDQEQLYDATQNQAALEKLVVDKRQAFDDAKARADIAAESLDRYRQAAMAQFQITPAMKQADVDVQAAQAALQRAVDEANQGLLSSPQYAEQFHQMRASAEIVRAQRAMNPPDNDVLTKEIANWRQARDAVDAMQRQAQASDSGVSRAAEQVAAAEHARKDLVDQFNRDLANDPAYKQLADAASEAASAASSAAAEVNAAQAQQDAIANQIAQLQATIDAQNAQLAQAEAAVTAYPSGGYGFAYQVSLCQTRIDNLSATRFRAWRYRQGCARRLGHDHDWHDWDRTRWADHHRGADHDLHPWVRDGRGNDLRHAKPLPPKVVVPYGPQPIAPQRVIPYGPQPVKASAVQPAPSVRSRRVVVREGPQPVRRTNNDDEHVRAVMRQGPQPAHAPKPPPPSRTSRSGRSDHASRADSPSRSSSHGDRGGSHAGGGGGGESSHRGGGGGGGGSSHRGGGGGSGGNASRSSGGGGSSSHSHTDRGNNGGSHKH